MVDLLWIRHALFPSCVCRIPFPPRNISDPEILSLVDQRRATLGRATLGPLVNVEDAQQAGRDFWSGLRDQRRDAKQVVGAVWAVMILLSEQRFQNLRSWVRLFARRSFSNLGKRDPKATYGFEREVELYPRAAKNPASSLSNMHIRSEKFTRGDQPSTAAGSSLEKGLAGVT